MKVVSAIKRVPEEIRQAFISECKDIEFEFCHGIEEAESPLKEAEVFVTYGEDVTPERIHSAKKLKWIMVLSAGIDKMPFDVMKERDILVTNVRGIHAGPMAEYAISMFLQVYRQAKVLFEQEKRKEWSRKPVMQEISGRTMLLLGTGAIPQETARLAKAFRMKTIGVSKSGRSKPYFDETYPVTELEQVLEEADFITAALPKTPETDYLLEEKHFKRMQDHVIFLNMGRGSLVSSEVLLEAVREKQIGHAVLDVFEEEPLPENHPLWEEDNVTITPHLSGISPYYLPRGFDIFKENLKVYVSGSGTMKNTIDLNRGY